MASAVELITLFLAIEFASIASYILAAYLRDDPKSAEAGLKYFLVGATTTAVALYGMSLVYGSTGTTHLYEIAEKLTPSLGEKGPAFGVHAFTMLGLLLMLAMLGSKCQWSQFTVGLPTLTRVRRRRSRRSFRLPQRLLAWLFS
jgi:NADH-quinone oxidoreductase subunit N